jgi:hypothetical protein
MILEKKQKTQMKFDEYFNINDTYKIKQDLEEIKKLISEIEKDITKFLGPNKPKIRGVKARSKITRLKNKLLPEMSRKILKTKQDYDSDYS